MRVLVACEWSGAVRDAFRRRGHDAWSCDTETGCGHFNRFHHRGDVMGILSDGWDMLIAFPPCTYLCNSGVRWLHERPARWQKMRDGAEFFRTLLDCDIPQRALENPTMHRYAARIVGSYPDQIIQPWQFGHGEQKATGLWLRGLPNLKPTDRVAGREQRIWKLPPSDDRGKLRGKTFSGVAEAMADQWTGAQTGHLTLFG